MSARLAKSSVSTRLLRGSAVPLIRLRERVRGWSVDFKTKALFARKRSDQSSPGNSPERLARIHLLDAGLFFFDSYIFSVNMYSKRVGGRNFKSIDMQTSWINP